MARKIEAVIFDWAGTTVDYGSFAPVQAFIEAFRQHGIEPSTEEVRKPMGMLKKNHIRTMLEMPRLRAQWQQTHGKDWDEADVDAVYASSEDSIMPILKDFADPKPFVLDTVATLRARGIKIGSTTGYTDEMMSIVVPKAKELGYAPDVWCSPNAVENLGRPYPYMIFYNMQALRIPSAASVVKVGDTVADIQEGKHAGVFTIGVVEGSSVMGLTQAEFQALSTAEQLLERQRVAEIYQSAGADGVIQNLSALLSVIDKLEAES